MCPSGKPSRTQAPLPSTAPYKPAFDVIDTDRDGKISREDLKTFYTDCGVGAGGAIPDEDLIRSMISVADFNKDGYVEYDEFERVLMEGATNNNKKKKGGEYNGGVLEDVFRVMDKDGDGMVSFEDLKGFMELAGLGADDEGIRGMILFGGGDLDNGVTFDGLVRIFEGEFGFAF